MILTIGTTLYTAKYIKLFADYKHVILKHYVSRGRYQLIIREEYSVVLVFKDHILIALYSIYDVPVMLDVGLQDARTLGCADIYMYLPNLVKCNVVYIDHHLRTQSSVMTVEIKNEFPPYNL